MSYRVRQDGMIETDTPEEAVELAALLDRKKHGKRPNADKPAAARTGTKTRTRRRGKAKTRAAAQNGRRPQGAVDNGIRLGQVWMKGGSSPSGGRTIQVDRLLRDGIVPKVLKDGAGVKRRSTVKQISYRQLRKVYKLIKDV